MADYHQLIARALADVGKNTDKTWRAALYARARGALVIELCSITPPLSEPEITHECLLFEESARKIEEAFTRTLSKATVPAPLPNAPEHPQQERLISEQGGSPIMGRETSVERAYIPNGNSLSDLEPPIELSDHWIAPCPVPLRTSGLEPNMDISMGEGINSCTLEKPVADFRHGSLWEFVDFEYETYRKDFGIQRRFRGEVFYRAMDSVFLGKEAMPAIVAALEGKVYKIHFWFTHITEKGCLEFGRDASDYFGAKYGLPSETREINKEQKAVFWDRTFGNVTLETDLFWRRNAIIYRSSVVRPKKRAWFGRILPSV
jgi:hypothetical protein